jgi:hypothetical protein
MSMENYAEQIRLAIQRYLRDDARKSGTAMQNGWSSLRPGKLYVMGFNPGGNPQAIKRNIGDSIQDLGNSYSAFTDECWIENHDEDCSLEECKSKARHQRTVCSLVNVLHPEFNVRDVFATNAIFMRSKYQDTLKGPRELWEKCWPVHQLFISIVLPRVIVCLGNGERLSAFSLIRSKFLGTPKVQHCGLNGFGTGNTRHPSHPSPSPQCPSASHLSRCNVVAWRLSVTEALTLSPSATFSPLVLPSTCTRIT